MSSIRGIPILAALLTAALPLHAQGGTTRYDAGSFTLDVPEGMRIVRNRSTSGPNTSGERFMGGNASVGMILVVHTSLQGVPQDPRTHTLAGARELMRDTATAYAAIHSPRDTSRALQRQLQRELRDTTIASRRQLVQVSRQLFRSGTRTMTLPADAREIVTDDRITLRSPVTVSLGDDIAPLQGTADITVPRRGDAATWIVVYANSADTPGLAETAARILDTFRLTGGPTTVPVQQKE